ncbi:hypothetical protein EV361DRAFT_601642 [Lentinula raphanica]|nr:hypothetical protein EV361DRAFT_601642 [Lentinula raphanica]
MTSDSSPNDHTPATTNGTSSSSQPQLPSTTNDSTSSPQPQPPSNVVENSTGPTSPSSSSLQPSATPAAESSATQTTTKKKRGNQGKIRGPQLTFLQSKIDAYLALVAKNERSKWIVSIIHEYFQAFPWHMGTEPAEFAILRDAGASLSSQERQELENARDEALCKTVKQGQIEVKNWIHRQTQRPAQRNGGEAFQRINNQLKQSTKLKRPRRKPDYKHFMSHPEYRDQCQEHYRDATADNPPSKAERIKRQCELAEDLYNQQPDDVKEKIALENSAQHSSRVDAFKKLLSGNGFSLEDVGELTDAEKQLCRTNLLTFIQPLLDAIRAHTGLWLTLLAGAPKKDDKDPKPDFSVIAISSGTVQGLKFHEYNSTDFNSNVMKTFLLFLHAASGERSFSAFTFLTFKLVVTR